MTDTRPDPLPPDTVVRLTAFARACKGAARAVALYPPDHPAVGEAIERLAHAADAATVSGPLAMLVVPDNLLVDGRALARPDVAVADLASLLHGHRAGEITIQHGVEPAAWTTLVTLLARDPEDIRAHGGLARALTTAGAIGITVAEFDYSGLFDDRGSGVPATWVSIVSRCLERGALDLDDSTLRLLGEIARDPARLGEWFERLEDQPGHQSPQELSASLLAALRSTTTLLGRESPGEVDGALGNMASALSRLSPEFVMEIVGLGRRSGSEHAGMVTELTRRVTDRTLAQLVARSAIHGRTGVARLAEVIRTLAPDPRRREAVAELAHEELARTENGEGPGFEQLWSQVADVLVNYSDVAYVPESYHHELTAAHRRATELATTFTDPPERIIGWLRTVSDVSVRALDLQLLTDLLAVETERERRRDLVHLVLFQVGDLAELGDFEGACRLLDAVQCHRETSADAAADLTDAIRRFADGPFISQVAVHLQAARDDEFEQVKALCAAVGPALVPKLAETLSAEVRPRARRRLADLLVAFGEHGRDSVQKLLESPNPGVRRTAVHLLRLCGGPESVPDLARLVADADPAVRRDAARALVCLGIDESFETVLGILRAATGPGRQTVVDELGSTRDSKATPLFCYLVRHLECWGELGTVNLQAIGRLGVLGGPDAVVALSAVLARGRWWAPFSTRAIRKEAAAALARIPLAAAQAALGEAAASGPIGARAIARRHLRTA